MLKFAILICFLGLSATYEINLKDICEGHSKGIILMHPADEDQFIYCVNNNAFIQNWIYKNEKCNHGELYPNLNDCSKYYQCVWGTKVEMNCPEGLNFNNKLKVCDYPETAGCEENSTTTTDYPTETTTTYYPSETTQTEDSNESVTHDSTTETLPTTTNFY